MDTSMPVRIGSGVMPGSVWGRRAIAGFSHWAWDARHGTGRLYSLSSREPGAGRPRPEEETLVSGLQARHPCLFPRRPTARATFVSAKVAKTIGAGHAGLANIRLARLRCASRASRAGANSHVPVLKQ